MGIKDRWNEGVERTRAQTAAAEAGRSAGVAAEAATKAQEAWDAGRAVYLMTLRFAGTAVLDDEAAVAVDGVMGVGWRLHSTAMAFVDRTGLNNISCMFTFVR